MNVKKQDAKILLKILEDAGYQARLVGGCVRDELLGLEPKDFDIATSASPEQMLVLFKKERVRTLEYGKEHGTIAALMKNGPVEVTTLREDVTTDGRRAEVAFHSDFKTDACRRDFTMNAMSEDRNGKIYDYFDGKKDLQDKHIRFVGEPTVRIREDYLRILRYFRFQSRFRLKSDASTLKAIADEVQGLSKVSKERITREIEGIFLSEKISSTLKDMKKTGVLSFIFPNLSELSKKEEHNFHQSVEKLKALPLQWRAISRLAILLRIAGLRKKKKDSAFEWRSFVTSEDIHLRLSNDEKNALVHLLEAAESVALLKSRQADLLLFIDRFDGKDGGLFLELVLPFLKVVYAHSPLRLKKLSLLNNTEKKFGYRRKPIPVQGKELMEALGIAPGPLVGEALHSLRYAYLDGEWDTKEEAFVWLRKLLV